MSRAFAWPNLTRSSVYALLLTTLVAGTVISPSAFSQGGPPFQSDDPDTPGDKQWEINVGFKGDRSLSEGSYSVPNIDINYGLGDRIQLKYELPLAVQEVRGGSSRTVSGIGNSLIGLKYRFYELSPTRVEQSDRLGKARSCGAGAPVSASLRGKSMDRPNPRFRGDRILVHQEECVEFLDTRPNRWSRVW
jgi:hypothetical protein